MNDLQQFEIDDFIYEIISCIDLTCRIKKCPDYICKHFVLPASVSYRSKQWKVTEIGGYAFYGCFYLTSVSIPNSILKICDSAFKDCYRLTSVYIPNSVIEIGNGVFRDCRGLTSVYIPNSVTEIGNGVFRDCRGLTSLSIPDSVGKIGKAAFKGCTGLISLTIPDSVEEIGDFAFYGCTGLTSVYIPKCVSVIGKYAFGDCASLTEFIVSKTNNKFCCIHGVLFNKSQSCLIQYPIGKHEKQYEIPNTVSEIWKGAFAQCHNLISVSIPNSVRVIGKKAFSDCISLTSVIIPDSVIVIGMHAFWGCSNLISVTIPNSVIVIGKCAFLCCSNLISVTIPSSMTKISDGTFGECSGLTFVFLPNSITKIGKDAFYNCISLTSVSIPNSVTKIDDGAFYGCSAITSIFIPNSVAYIGDGVFGGCSVLTEIGVSEKNNNFSSLDGVLFDKTKSCLMRYPIGKIKNHYTIPSSILKVEDGAFLECRGIKSVAIPKLTNRIGDNVFRGCSGLVDIFVSEDNMSYSSLDGVLFNKSMSCLIRYPDGKPSIYYTIPSSVSEIGRFAFEGCSCLLSVLIPNSVTKIEDSAFAVFSGSLRKVALPFSIMNSFDSLFSLVDEIKYNVEDSICEAGFVYGGNGTRLLFAPTDITSWYVVPESIKRIEDKAFIFCTQLKRIDLTGASVASNAFDGVEVESIYNSLGDLEAFSNAKLIVLSNKCKSVSGISSNVQSIFCPLFIPPTATAESFTCDREITQIFIPKGFKAVYEHYSGWKDFRNLIEVDEWPVFMYIKLNYTQINAIIGQFFELKATVIPEDTATTVMWESSNEDVVKIFDDGFAQAVGAGKAVITATIVNYLNLKAICDINVTCI